MKNKLTLTVKKDLIQKAKKIAKMRNISVSRLFEESIESNSQFEGMTEKQRNLSSLLDLIEKNPQVKPKKRSDKELIKSKIRQKHGKNLS